MAHGFGKLGVQQLEVGRLRPAPMRGGGEDALHSLTKAAYPSKRLPHPIRLPACAVAQTLGLDLIEDRVIARPVKQEFVALQPLPVVTGPLPAG